MKYLKNNRWLQHLLFWAFSFYVLNRLFAKEYGDELLKVNLIYTALFHLSLLLVVYLNLLVFIPRFLSKGKYLLYAIFIVGGILLGIYFNFFTFDYLSNKLFSDYYFISYFQFKDIAQFMVVYIVITTLLKFSKSWFQLTENQRFIDQLEREKSNAELNALKLQINPHFLFNSLNNLYSLALDKDERIPELILKLSQGMRYMLYESNDHFVPLKKEIEYLKNYLELQRLRTHNRAKIDFSIDGNLEKIKIPPMIFIPFVENGFKHGIKGDIDNSFINIQLKIDGKKLIFKTQNNKGEIDEVEPQEFRGFGLKNVKRRLELLYPKNHELTIDDGEKTFTVELIIPNVNIQNPII